MRRRLTGSRGEWDAPGGEAGSNGMERYKVSKVLGDGTYPRKLKCFCSSGIVGFASNVRGLRARKCCTLSFLFVRHWGPRGAIFHG